MCLTSVTYIGGSGNGGRRERGAKNLREKKKVKIEVNSQGNQQAFKMTDSPF